MRGLIRCVLAALLLVAAAATVDAQDRRDSKNTNRATRAFVQVDGGTKITGRLVALTPESVELLVRGNRVDIPLSQVSVVEVGGDPVDNGALIGAVVLGGLCALNCGQGMASGGEYALAVAFNFGLGVLIGAGIDAMQTQHTTLFRKESAAPPVPKLRPAVSFTLRF